MEIHIKHITNYQYKYPISGLVQSTKLYPSSYKGLEILSWHVRHDSAKKSKIYKDAEANNIQSFTNAKPVKSIQFTVTGKVKTFDTKGVYSNSDEKINPLVYLRESKLTIPDVDLSLIHI